MAVTEKDILNLFTSNDILSDEILDNHNRLYRKIAKHKDFDLEKILIELPYIEILKNYRNYPLTSTRL
jgi:hypothetical protein